MPTFNELSSDRVLSAIVIGCGTIAGLGARKDHQATHPAVTHADACDRHPGIALRGAIDTNPDNLAAFAAEWGVSSTYASFEDWEKSGDQYDIACLCTPSSQHYGQLLALAETPVRGVFCEKPFLADEAPAAEICDLFDTRGIALQVNYTRRWNATFIELRDQISKGKWGALRKGFGFYAKGLRNYGSHLLNLLEYLIGPLTVSQALGVRVDHTAEDPTIDALLIGKDGSLVYLVGGDARNFTTLQLDLFFEHGIIRIDRGGMRMTTTEAVESPLWPGIREPGKEQPMSTQWDSQLIQAIENLHQTILHADVPSLCSGRDAIKTETICTQLLRASRDLTETD